MEQLVESVISGTNIIYNLRPYSDITHCSMSSGGFNMKLLLYHDVAKFIAVSVYGEFRLTDSDYVTNINIILSYPFVALDISELRNIVINFVNVSNTLSNASIGEIASSNSYACFKVDKLVIERECIVQQYN